MKRVRKRKVKDTKNRVQGGGSEGIRGGGIAPGPHGAHCSTALQSSWYTNNHMHARQIAVIDVPSSTET